MRFGALFISVLIVLGFSMPGFAQPFAYITNVIDDTVSVIDTATNTVIDTIIVGDRPIPVAVSPDGTRVYVGNNDDDTVSVIDTSTNTVIDTVNVGDGPIGMAVTPDNTRVYVANEDDDTVSGNRHIHEHGY